MYPAMRYLLFLITFSYISMTLSAFAGSRFDTRGVSCSDSGRYCSSGAATRKIDGFDVYKECWEWSYTKTCNYPSLNDCSRYSHCYSLGQRDCLLRDSLGNCVNIKKEFSCKRWVPTYVESEHARVGLQEKAGREGLVCKGIPCIDGNCVDKSYDMDSDIVQSVSQLGAMAQGKVAGNGIKIFEGLARHCSKKPTGYTDCCAVHPKGWGRSLGANCTKEECALSEAKQKNLCVHVGRTINKTAGVKTLIKRHYCCFGNILEKTIQVEGRKQLGLNFGSGGNANCRGLTPEEIARIDFSKMDFSEIAAQMQKKIVMPNIADVEGRIRDTFSNVKEFDKNHPESQENKAAGVNKGVM